MNSIEVLPPVRTKNYNGPDRRYESKPPKDSDRRKQKSETKNDFKNKIILNSSMMTTFVDDLERTQSFNGVDMIDLLDGLSAYKKPDRTVCGIMLNLIA